MTTNAALDIAGSQERFHRAFRAGALQRVEVPAGTHPVRTSTLAILHWVPLPDGAVARSAVEAATLASDAFAIIAPNQPMELNFSEPKLIDILQICPQTLDSQTGGDDIRFASKDATSLPPLQTRIWERLIVTALNSEEGADQIVQLCVEILLSGLFAPEETPIDSPLGRALAGNHYDALVRAINFIEANLDQKIEVSEIARQAGLSPFYFSRLFRAACGTSVYGYVIETRLKTAQRLLEKTDLALSTIAFETGFSSQSHFTTSFRTRFGTTPHAHRKQFRR